MIVVIKNSGIEDFSSVDNDIRVFVVGCCRRRCRRRCRMDRESGECEYVCVYFVNLFI